MKNLRLFFVICAISLLFADAFSQVTFVRKDTIAAPSPENSGFGNMFAGVDFDGDGKKEIYAVNSNWNDAGKELIPSAYKFEWTGTKFDTVWRVDLAVPKQNTWPALTYGDWDKDGKSELIWGPVNFTEAGVNPNPGRIFVFESNPPNKYMGVDLGFEAYDPNAKWTIVSTDLFNLRPFKWELADLDGDSKPELCFADRASSATGYRFGIVGVSDVPNNGGGAESWTLKFSGKDTTLPAGTIYDEFVLDGTFYLINTATAGTIIPVKYQGGAYRILKTQDGLVPNGSWKSAMTVDVDKDNQKEVVVGSFGTGTAKVFLLQKSGDTLKSTEISDFSSLIGAGRIYGGANGDIDGDGKIDFVFGTRGATPNAAIVWLKYKGGDITNPANYEAKIIDSGIRGTEGRYDILAVADVDNDNIPEVIYSSGIGDMVPLVILKRQGGSDVKSDLNQVPKEYQLQQNYPNPFNPATTINFAIPKAGFVKLSVYNTVGEVVSVLINQELQAGSHQVSFNGKDLPSGTYIYELQVNNTVQVKKMMLVK